MDSMKEVFRLHGAAPMASTGVGIAPTDFPPDAVSLLAPCGSPWGLRYDLRYPFAAWLARQAALPGTGAPPTPPCATPLCNLPASAAPLNRAYGPAVSFACRLLCAHVLESILECIAGREFLHAHFRK